MKMCTGSLDQMIFFHVATINDLYCRGVCYPLYFSPKCICRKRSASHSDWHQSKIEDIIFPGHRIRFKLDATWGSHYSSCFFHKANSLKKKLALLQSFSDCWIKLLRFSPVKTPFPFHVLIYFICVSVCVRWNLTIANWQILLVSVNALWSSVQITVSWWKRKVLSWQFYSLNANTKLSRLEPWFTEQRHKHDRLQNFSDIGGEFGSRLIVFSSF